MRSHSFCQSGALALLCGLAASVGAPTTHATDRAVSVTPLYAFPAVADGTEPWCTLVADGALLYGTTYTGGAYGRGAIFSINPATGAEKILYSFQANGDATNPQAGLTKVGSLLYGVSNTGGASGYGAVYAFNPATSAETVIFSLTPEMGGGSGANIVSGGGYLYGGTFGGGTGLGYGVIFKVNLKTNAGSIVYAFTNGADGAGIQAGLAYVGGTLYGSTSYGGPNGAGALFAVNAATGAETTLHTFTGGADGGGDNGGVIAVNGVLYGTTAYGGTPGTGTVFSYTLATSTLKTVYTFQGGADGAGPQGTLLDLGGTLYGTAEDGGVSGMGTVFAVSTVTGKASTLYSFPGGSNGAFPLVGLVSQNGNLYGTATQGNSPGIYDGSVFAINLKTRAETTLHSFTGASNEPVASPVSNSGGTLYGTASGSAAAPYGAIYSADAATGTHTTLYTFTGGADGGAPSGGLTLVGKLYYGVATLGGANGTGGVFSFDPATGSQTMLASLPATDSRPSGPLTLVKGVLYGVTEFGGTGLEGAIFAYTIARNTLTFPYNFAGSDGGFPAAGLLASGTMLYGTTLYGGFGYGTAFAFDTATAALTTLHNFAGGTDGIFPSSVPVIVNGTLYGSTQYGGNAPGCVYVGFGCGTLYGINLTSGATTILHAFNYADGAYLGPVIADGNTLYGTAGVGGSTSYGLIYSYDLAGNSFAPVYTFTGNADGAKPDGLTRTGTTIYGVTGGGGTYGQGVLVKITGF